MSEINYVAEADTNYLVDSARISAPMGYQQTESGMIPADWESTTLGKIAEVRMCKRILSAQTEDSGEIPFFKIGTFGGRPDAYISSALYNEFKAKYSFPDKGDILISAAGTLGKVVVYDGEPAYFQDSNIVWLEINKRKICNEFLYHCYKVIDWASPEGSTISRLYNGIIRASVISLPSLEEQLIIANALSDVDALIDSLEKLIAKKQAIKTATMQQLLTGKTRLPQFATHPDGTPKGYKQSELGEIPEDWGVKSVIDIAEYQKAQFDDGDWVEAEHITDKGIRLIQTGNIGVGEYLEKDSKKYIYEESFTKLKCKELKIGDLLICRLAEPAGRACILPDIAEEKIITSVDVTIFRPKPEIADRQYLVQYFSSEQWFKSVLEQVGGTTHKRISRGALGRLVIPYPPIEEQHAVSKILVDMSEDICKIQQRIHKTRQLKQGMMQELLTGKIRLVKPAGSAA